MKNVHYEFIETNLWLLLIFRWERIVYQLQYKLFLRNLKMMCGVSISYWLSVCVHVSQIQSGSATHSRTPKIIMKIIMKLQTKKKKNERMGAKEK